MTVGTFSATAVARMFGVSRETILGRCRDGRIAAQQTRGGHHRIPATEVERLKRDGLAPVKVKPARLLRVGQVARLVGQSSEMIRYHCARGEIRAARTSGGHYRISAEEVERLRAEGESANRQAAELARALLTVTQAAKELGVSDKLVRLYCRRGTIAALSTEGGHYRIARAELERVRADRAAVRSLANSAPTPVALPPDTVLQPKDYAPKTAPTFVYFVRAGETGPVKIGFAANVEARVRGIQSNNHEVLRVVAVVPGGLALEQKYHARFAHLRLHGEWFSPGDDLLAFVADLAARQ